MFLIRTTAKVKGILAADNLDSKLLKKSIKTPQHLALSELGHMLQTAKD